MKNHWKIYFKIILTLIFVCIPILNIVVIFYPLMHFKNWRLDNQIKLDIHNKFILGFLALFTFVLYYQFLMKEINSENLRLWYSIITPIFSVWLTRILGYYGLYKYESKNLDFLYNRIVRFFGLICIMFYIFLMFLN